jgi:tetratricopeptide (TPR) repeat protein
VVLESLGRLDEAVNHYRRAIAADPALLPAHRNLATLLHRTERFEEAATAYRDWLQLAPDAIAGWWNLGIVSQELERFDDAVQSYERAMTLDPAFSGAIPSGAGTEIRVAEFFDRIGSAYRFKRSFETALRFFERALEAAPHFVPARLNRAAIHHNLGMLSESIPGFREIVRIEPRHPHATRHLLMELLYTPASAESLFEEHLAYGRRLGSGSRPALPLKAGAGSRGKLRIGYVSSDFRMHAVGYNLQRHRAP